MPPMSRMHHYTSGRRDNKLLTEENSVINENQTIPEQVAKVELKQVETESEAKLRLFLLNEKTNEKIKEGKI